MSEGLKRGARALLELIYPIRAECMGCGSRAGFERDWLCEDCRLALANRWVGAAPPPCSAGPGCGTWMCGYTLERGMRF